MSDTTHSYELATSTGELLPLKGAHVEASLFGLLAIVELKQQWCNSGSEAIEALYTFPLAASAQLIGLSMTVGERSLEGQVQAKAKATARYEEAISEGQRAALVMDAGEDLKQISLGNIQPGDEIAITLRWVEPLRWSDRNLRWRLPTVIAPRYGDPRRSGLTSDQVPHTDLAAGYDLTLQVRLQGELARTAVTCPTHQVAVSGTGEQLVLQLAADARLDRDFVLNLRADAPQAAELWKFRGEKGQSALLSFQPPMIASPMEAGQSLVVLVDCSGSMGGDSIRQAREGLKAYLGVSRPQDRLSIIRFGSSVEHCTPEPVLLDQAGRALLAAKIDAEIEADLGGTEIIEALQEAIRVAGANGQILLITDGEVYTSAEDVAQVVAGQCRIFPVGVGSAVSEHFLQELADKTGGYCELVTPNENMALVISAQCRRLTLAPVTAEISWQQAPAWVEQGPLKMFVGDSVLLAANGDALDLASLTLCSEGVRRQLDVQLRELDAQTGEVLRRYCSARRLPTLSDEAATALAVEEGLLCRHTAMVAVDSVKHETDGLPKLVEVPQMMAAGSHGYGSVQSYSMACDEMHISMCLRSAPSPMQFSMASKSAGDFDFSFDMSSGQLDVDLAHQLEQLAGSIGNGVGLESVLAPAWLDLLLDWAGSNDIKGLSEAQLLACFIAAALPLVRDELQPELVQTLRREAMQVLPASVDLSRLKLALLSATAGASGTMP
jgi:Ca-activated chloride channel family protein